MKSGTTPLLGKITLCVLLALVPLLIAACGGNGDTASDEGQSDTVELAPAQEEDEVLDVPDADDLYEVIVGNTDGETLFVTLCAKCHGLEGHGDGPSAASLNIQGSMLLTQLDDRSDEELLRIITVGTGVDMPAWGLILTQEQREAVLAYVRTLGED